MADWSDDRTGRWNDFAALTLDQSISFPASIGRLLAALMLLGFRRDNRHDVFGNFCPLALPRQCLILVFDHHWHRV